MAKNKKSHAYPASAPKAKREGPGYPGERFNDAKGRYPTKAFPGNADHAGKAPGAAGKGYSKQVPERNKLPAYEEYQPFPKNPGQD